MTLCGSVQQTKDIIFKAVDNRKRLNATVSVLMHIGQDARYLTVTETDASIYEFGFSHNERGVAIVEIFFDGVQIPDSPIRVDIADRNCNLDFPGQRMVSVSTSSASHCYLCIINNMCKFLANLPSRPNTFSDWIWFVRVLRQHNQDWG